MSKTRYFNSPKTHRLWFAAAGISIIAAFACCNDTSEEQVQPYAYDSYYYTADLAATSMYWADSWVYDPYYYYAYEYPDAGGAEVGAPAAEDAGPSGADAGAPAAPDAGPSIVRGVAAVIRTLAEGGSACDGGATLTTKMVDAPCTDSGGPGRVRGGVSLAFNGCALPGGGRLDGKLDVDSVHTSNDCNPGSVINVAYTSTYTDLSYTAPNGARIVIPSQTDTGSFQRALNAAPGALTVRTKGSLQRFRADKSQAAAYEYSGIWNFTFSMSNPSYSLSGTTTLQEQPGGRRLTVTSDSLVRSTTCCIPTNGKIIVSGTGHTTNTWVFGPECGAVSENGTSTNFAECI